MHAILEERRSHYRRATNQVTIRNLSQTSIGFYVERELVPGREITVDLASKGSAFQRRIHARVLYQVEMGDGRSIVGARFTSPLSDSEVEQLKGSID